MRFVYTYLSKFSLEYLEYDCKASTKSKHAWPWSAMVSDATPFTDLRLYSPSCERKDISLVNSRLFARAGWICAELGTLYG